MFEETVLDTDVSTLRGSAKAERRLILTLFEDFVTASPGIAAILGLGSVGNGSLIFCTDGAKGAGASGGGGGGT